MDIVTPTLVSMIEAAVSARSAWESFYVIVGSSGAALTGLMFVVITLIADLPQRNSTDIGTFGTPTIVHFCVALLVSAIIAAPWRELRSIAWAIGLVGGVGLLYTAIVMWRAGRSTSYQPVFEDWIFHVILPFVAYLTFLIGGITLPLSESALFPIAGAALLLLFIGIHNAWDTVTFLAIELRNKRPDSPD